MHGPFLAVSALLIAISTVIPIPGQASGSGKPDAPNGSFVEVENGKIYYEECGNAPTTVVLIHDGIAHSVVWDGCGLCSAKTFAPFAMTGVGTENRPLQRRGTTKPMI